MYFVQVLLLIKLLSITSEKCFEIVLQFVTGLIIWMQNFFSPSENLGLNTTKQQLFRLVSKLIPSVKAGILPPVKLIRPWILPVPSQNLNMLELFSRWNVSSLPTIDMVQKFWPSNMESSLSSLLIWWTVRGMIALSFTGLYSFFPEYMSILLLPANQIIISPDYKNSLFLCNSQKIKAKPLLKKRNIILTNFQPYPFVDFYLFFTMYPNNNPPQIINAVNQRWPYLEARDPQDFNSIVETFPHLKNVNTDRDTHSHNNIGLIIRSANDDNVHKAIKYGIWTTTPKNKTKLEQLWQKHLKDKTEVYLFFSVVKSGMFEGVARLASDYYEETFPFWWENQSLKFKGFFVIEWVYIKDVNYKHFDGLYNVDNEEVTKSKDCDILDYETTNEMLEIFKKRPLKRWIFDDFDKMDDREKNYTRKVYEHVLTQQQYYGGFNYNSFKQMPSSVDKQMMGAQNLYGSQMPIQPTMMPIPPQMMRPQHLDPNPSNGMNFLGFQMNPVSKNRKK